MPERAKAVANTALINELPTSKHRGLAPTKRGAGVVASRQRMKWGMGQSPMKKRKHCTQSKLRNISRNASQNFSAEISSGLQELRKGLNGVLPFIQGSKQEVKCTK